MAHVDNIKAVSWLSAEADALNRSAFVGAEFENFDAACRDFVYDHWRAVQAAHSNDTRAIVFDARHNEWLGIGDSAARILALLRLGRSTGRATYIWQDPCADAHGPPRTVRARTLPNTRHSEACAFDFGMYFTTVGNLDFRWSAAKRRTHERLNSVHLVYGCATASTCALKDASGNVLARDEAAAVDVIRNQSAGLLVVELTSVDDFKTAVTPLNEPCELFLNARPKPVLWEAMKPHVQRLTRAEGYTAALFVRTGYADHFSYFKDELPEHHDDTDFKSLQRLFTSCPDSAPSVVRVRGDRAPCVKYQQASHDPVFVPAPPGHELAFYVDDAKAGALECGGGNETKAWTVLVATDSPAVRRFASSRLGDHAMHVAATPGHVQYDGGDRQLGLETAAEFYLAGCMRHHVVLADSWFATVAKARSLRYPCALVGKYGWPQLFRAGNERALSNGNDLETMTTLS